MDYKQISEFQWEWEDAGKFHGIRIFAKTRTIIWSGWIETGEGPKFEPGISQTLEQFLANGAPPSHKPPPDLLRELTETVQRIHNANAPKRRWMK